MDEQEKALDRFVTRAEAFKVVFRPQCIDCTHNMERHRCSFFDNKPLAYGENKRTCPHFQSREKA